jgi:hypothetical protein
VSPAWLMRPPAPLASPTSALSKRQAAAHPRVSSSRRNILNRHANPEGHECGARADLCRERSVPFRLPGQCFFEARSKNRDGQLTA